MQKFGTTLLRACVIAALSLIIVTQVYAATANDPTVAGPYTAGNGEYKFPAKIDSVVTPYLATEIWARVWYPSNKSGKSPLVILLHGNHGTCGHTVGQFRIDDRTDYSTTGKCPSGYVVTPNHMGYVYVAAQLATRGYIVVSINANRGITAAPEDSRENDPSLIKRRGRMILRHMQLLYGWHANGGQPGSIGYNLRGRIDFTKVTLFGHSRGGDGIVAAYNLYRTSSSWRSAIPGAVIVGLASLAPTDVQVDRPNVMGAKLAVLLPMCDGDVNRLSGIGFYDRSVSGAPDTAGNFKSVFATWGANHDGYNTQWQADDNNPNDHTCPNQNRLFTPGPGLVPTQQKIGRYFLMALVRGTSELPGLAQLFNPAFTLPSGLKSLTRIDRSFFAGRGSITQRFVRFDGTCSSKLAVTTGVSGSCSNTPEHNSPTTAAVIRWGSPASTPQSSNYAVFTLNGGTAFNMNRYTTLDMRVAPDCHKLSNGNVFACDGTTLQGNGLGGAQGVFVYLQDSNGNFSNPVNMLTYTDRREAIGVSTTNLPVNPLYHAIFSSVRMPVSAFPKSGFSITSVKKIWIYLGNQSSKGGLWFGDVTGVSLGVTSFTSATPEAPASAAVAQVTPDGVPQPPRDAVLVPASDQSADAGVTPAIAEPAVPAEAGNRIISATRSTLSVGTGQPAPNGNPELAPTRPAAAIEFTIETPQQIMEGDAGLSVRIGGQLIHARRFATGRENDTPSVIKLVVPADAVNAAADGASLAVVGPGSVHQFGPLAKSAIR